MTEPHASDSPQAGSIPAELPAVTPAEVSAFRRLLGLIRRLRGPGGCPWDREQTLRTMTPYIVEETYEVVDAIERDDPAALREELGDVIFLLFFCLEIARESGRFRIEEALEDHLRKMVRRHPHVFGEVGRLRSADAARQWEELKQSEKQSEASGPRSVLAGRLPGLPALTAAFRVQEKVSAVGFDWPALDGVLDKVEEELGELRAALAPAGAPPQPRTRSSSDGDAPAAATEAQRAELGDLLFSLVNVARFLTIDPEAALRGTTVRFSERFRYIEQRLAARGRTPTDASLAEMDALWDEAKHALHGAGGAARPRDGDPPPESRVDPTES